MQLPQFIFYFNTRNGLCASNSVQLNRNSEYYSSFNCISCINLKNQLREAHLEISSLQYINQLLYKELNNGVLVNTVGEWTRRLLDRKCSHRNITTTTLDNLKPYGQHNQYQLLRFLILARLPDPVAENNATSSESKGTINGLNHYHSYKRKEH
jgi:hypothetical protein